MFGFLKKKKKKKSTKETPKQVQQAKQDIEVEGLTEEAATPKKRKAVIHITRHKDGGWQVKKEGAARAIRKCKTQKEAIDLAKEIEKEKGTGYIIHKADGSTRKKKY